MKLKILLSLILTSFLMFSCKESSVEPQEKKLTREQIIQLISQKTWITAKTSHNNVWMFDASQTNFESDGTIIWKCFFTDIPKMRQSGTWSINEKGDTLILSRLEEIKFYISYVDEATIRLIEDQNSEQIELWGVPKKEYALAIVGTIDNKQNVKLESDYKVNINWLVDSEDQGDYLYSWGHGDIDVLRNRFFILLNSLPPQEVLSPITDYHKLGVGYVYLSKIQQPEGIVDYQSISNSIIGAVNDRSIIYLDNDLVEPIDPEWLNYYFSKGWNFAKGTYSGEKDGWSYIKSTNVELTVDINKNFSFPDWK